MNIITKMTNNTNNTNMQNINTNIEDTEFVDYPYIGIGKKPFGKKLLTDEELERIIGG